MLTDYGEGFAVKAAGLGLLAPCAFHPEEFCLACFAVQLINQTFERVETWNIGTARADESTTKRGDAGFPLAHSVDNRGPQIVSLYRGSSISSLRCRAL
jgi:hypothetical protein